MVRMFFSLPPVKNRCLTRHRHSPLNCGAPETCSSSWTFIWWSWYLASSWPRVCSAQLHGKRRRGGGVRGWHYGKHWSTCQYYWNNALGIAFAEGVSGRSVTIDVSVQMPISGFWLWASFVAFRFHDFASYSIRTGSVPADLFVWRTEPENEVLLATAVMFRRHLPELGMSHSRAGLSVTVPSNWPGRCPLFGTRYPGRGLALVLPGVTHLAARKTFCAEVPLKGVQAIRRSKSVFGTRVNWASKSRSHPLVPWPCSLLFINCSTQPLVGESRDNFKTGPQTPSIRCRHPLKCKDDLQPQNIDEPRSHVRVLLLVTAPPLRRNHQRPASSGAALLPSNMRQSDRRFGPSLWRIFGRSPYTSREIKRVQSRLLLWKHAFEHVFHAPEL